jgi:hypothetical protein
MQSYRSRGAHTPSWPKAFFVDVQQRAEILVGGRSGHQRPAVSQREEAPQLIVTLRRPCPAQVSPVHLRFFAGWRLKTAAPRWCGCKYSFKTSVRLRDRARGTRVTTRPRSTRPLAAVPPGVT